MNLTPREKDKLLVAMAAEVARKRLARGVKLNHPEAVALISDFIVEGARDGRGVAELAEGAARVVRADQVMDGIAAMIGDLEVEATFPDGMRVVAVHQPIQKPGSAAAPTRFVPGEIASEDGAITMNAHRAVLELEVANESDRTVDVGSHFHFAETNPALRFDRQVARGRRLDIVPGTALRFEAGETRTVRLIQIGGTQEVVGFRGDVMGALEP